VMGTNPLHAVGTAYAAKHQKEKICTIAYFGDGATSEGDFHEAEAVRFMNTVIQLLEDPGLILLEE